MKPVDNQPAATSVGSLLPWFRFVLLAGSMLCLPGVSQEAPEVVPTAVLPTSPSDLSVERLQARIRDLDAATEMDAAQKGRLVEVYRQIVQRLEDAAANAEKAEVHRQSLEAAPRATAELRRQLEEMKGADDKEALRASLPVGLTAGEAEQKLNEALADLARLKMELEGLGKQLQAELNRPAAARTQLAESKNRLAEIETDLSAPAPSADAPELARAQRMLLETRRQFRTGEVFLIDQELLSGVARGDLLTVKRDLAAQGISRLGNRIKLLETKVSELRQAEAGQARAEAERIRREAIGKHSLVQALAEDIGEITLEAQEIGPAIDTVQRDRTQLESQLEQTKSDLEEATKMIELGGVREAMGPVLVEQRRNLPGERGFQKAVEVLARKKSQERLLLFKLDRQLKQLSDFPKAAEALLAGKGSEGLDSIDRDAVRLELEELLAAKREHLDRLGKSRRSYLKELDRSIGLNDELARETGRLAELLDEHLLWTRSADPVGVETWRDVREALGWLLGGDAWLQTGTAFKDDLIQVYPVYLFFIPPMILLMALHRRLLERLSATGAVVGNVRKDSLYQTVQALGCTLLRSLAAPGLLAFLGWRLALAPVGSDVTQAIGHGCGQAAAAWLGLRFVRDLCRGGGVGEEHFRWATGGGQAVRLELLWFQFPAVLMVFLLALTNWHGGLSFRHGLGRMAFIVLVVSTGFLLMRLLRVLKQSAENVRAGGRYYWIAGTRKLWQPLVGLLHVVLAGLALAGYYYTALQLGRRLCETAGWVLAALLIHALFHRWLLISQRRIALQVALEKRRAQKRSRETGEIEAEAAGEIVHDPAEEIDVEEIGEQSSDLLRMSAWLLVIVGLWFAWSGMLPALKVFEGVHLWSHKAVIDGQEKLIPVTLTNLLMGLGIVAVTVGAARKMPPFLEMALLQRLFDPGARYATRTLILYGIACLGGLLAADTLGLSWSSVQWLVAALTVGLGFGLQEIFANFVSGLIILLERPIRVGDTVTVGLVSGIVTRIRMRATTITDWNRKELIVPNKSFITGELINWTLSDPLLRMDFAVGVAYGSDTALVERVLLQVCRDHPLVLAHPEPSVLFTNFGDNSLTFEVRVFVAEPSNSCRWRILHDLHMTIDQVCRKHKIVIAFPQRDLHLVSADAVLRVAHVDLPDDRPDSVDRAGDPAES